MFLSEVSGQISQDFIADDWKEVGNLLIQRYLPTEYKELGYMRSAAINKEGMLIFTNGFDIKIFDGSDFTYLPRPSEKFLPEIQIWNDTLWLAGMGEIGYWLKDQFGQYSLDNYHSISSLLPDSIKSNLDICRIESIGDFHYFISKNGHLLKYHNQEFKFWQLDNPGIFLFKVHDTIYFKQKTQLYKLDNDQIQPIQIWNKKNEAIIQFMIPYADDKILIATAFKLFIYDYEKVIPFAVELNEIFSQALMLTGVNIRNDLFAIGSYRKGIIIINKQGKLCKWVDQEKGLTDNNITYMLNEQSDVIWAGTFKGINRIKVASNISQFDNSLGIENKVNDIVRYKGKLLASSASGVYEINHSNNFGIQPHFEKLKNADIWAFDLNIVGNKLLIGANNGLYVLNQDKLEKI